MTPKPSLLNYIHFGAHAVTRGAYRPLATYGITLPILGLLLTANPVLIGAAFNAGLAFLMLYGVARVIAQAADTGAVAPDSPGAGIARLAALGTMLAIPLCYSALAYTGKAPALATTASEDFCKAAAPQEHRVNAARAQAAYAQLPADQKKMIFRQP